MPLTRTTFDLHKVNVATAAVDGSYPLDVNIAGLAFLAPASGTPEPGSIVLLTARVGLIGFAARPRKNASR